MASMLIYPKCTKMQIKILNLCKFIIFVQIKGQLPDRKFLCSYVMAK